MAWTGTSSSSTYTGGEFAAAQAANLLHEDEQKEKAARVVAGWATDAADCAETLAMLGLTVPRPRRRER